MDRSAALQRLSDAWRRRRRLAALPAGGPTSEEDAYRDQDRLLRTLSDQIGAPVGYKIGCTNASAQRLLGLDEPFYGRLVAGRTRASPARFAAADFFMRIIEPEFAFRMAADLPPRERVYQVAEVADAVGAVLPAIEIVDSRFDDWTAVGSAALIVDNGSHGAWAFGAGRDDWRAFDLPNHEVSLAVNDKTLRAGRGDLVMGDPLHALCWLANRLRVQGKGLAAGDRVSTGTCCDVYPAAPGDRVRADFGTLGVVEVDFY